MVQPETVIVISIVFASTLTRSTFGFGEAMIAMPLLSLVVDIKVAAPLVAMVALANSIAILSTDWRNILWPGAWRLIVGALIGIPIGVYALARIPEHYVKLLLALVVISFALYRLLRPQLGKLSGDGASFLFGFFSGILGGAYNTPGPPVIVFGSLRDWTAGQFRATFQVILLSVGAVVIPLHGVAGLWTSDVLRLLPWAVPVVLVTAPLGKWLNRRIQAKAFRRILLVGLLIIGSVLLITSLWDCGFRFGTPS